MKIKTQFKFLIISIVLIPFIYCLGIFILQYITSPHHYLLKGYRQIRELDNIDFSENDWKLLKERIKHIPPNMQTVVYYDSTILISSIPELKQGNSITPIDLFNFIRNTSDKYDYQMQTPYMTIPNKNKRLSTLKEAKFLIVSRATVKKHRIYTEYLYIPALLCTIVFETICAIFIINLSTTITNSITLLEKTTQKIAAGDLDAKIIPPKNGQNANEITSLTESLEKMRQSLKDDQERRAKFIMGISHDLRTPVALIKGYAEAISDGVVNDMETVRKSLYIINTKADQLESMINDLINYVKLNNTDWQQLLEFVNIKPILIEFANTAHSTADVYKRKINSSIKISDSTKIRMDKHLFNRALENLFSNAFRYTKDNDTINISATENEDSIRISIEDTGIGISEKDLQHIYDLFYRGTNSRRESGMGIGLSVVKTIIDTHGWKINVNSSLGKGTKFIIIMPKK